jgi:hypothetical protein
MPCLPRHYSPVPCSVDSGFARVTDKRCFDAAHPQRKDNPPDRPRCAVQNSPSGSGNAELPAILALREIEFFVWINPLAGDHLTIHT